MTRLGFVLAIVGLVTACGSTPSESGPLPSLPAQASVAAATPSSVARVSAAPSVRSVPDYVGTLQGSGQYEPGTYSSNAQFCVLLYPDGGGMIELRLPPGWETIVQPHHSATFVMHTERGSVVARPPDRIALNGEIVGDSESFCELNDTDIVQMTEVVQVWP